MGSIPLREAFGYILAAGAVWLGWEAVRTALADRGPPALSVRLAPGSPEVLRRAAEAELIAGRFENAEALSAESLARAPFNARAMRVRGLSEAQVGNADRADEMLTLAGNWSLRDDPAHAWLIENRLRRGDYRSAFAHADTLARRRVDLYPSLFRLFTTASVQDKRALPVIAGLLAQRPPWRGAYLEHLHEADNGAPVIGGLAIALQQTDGPFNSYELQRLYQVWIRSGRFEGVLELRRRLGRPPVGAPLQNGDFSTAVDDQLLPFGWAIESSPGLGAAVLQDDLRPDNAALRLEYDGFGSGVFTRQLLLVGSGEFTLEGEWRAETPLPDLRIAWQLVCAESGMVLGSAGSGLRGDSTDWKAFRRTFIIPRENCRAQWLQLAAVPGDRRTTIAAWFDKLRISPTAPTAGAAAERGSSEHPGT